MAFYPPKISERIRTLSNVGRVPGENGVGTSASFACGAFIRLSLKIEKDTKQITAAKFQTNGCGYMIAAADVFTEHLIEKRLTQLHGLSAGEFDQLESGELEAFHPSRHQCYRLVGDAFRNALAEYRRNTIEEFQGEKALICTCFGVSEEAIETCIDENSLRSVDEVTEICRAGGGCGSCQFLIQEILDAKEPGQNVRATRLHGRE